MVSGINNPMSTQPPRLPWVDNRSVTIPRTTQRDTFRSQSQINNPSTSTQKPVQDSVVSNTQSKSFKEAVKNRWDDYGLGAPLKAVSDMLIRNPKQSVSEYGIIGWFKMIIASTMELIASPLQFISNVVKNTGPEIKNLFSKKENTQPQQPSSSSSTSSIRDEDAKKEKKEEVSEQVSIIDNKNQSARDSVSNNP